MFFRYQAAQTMPTSDMATIAARRFTADGSASGSFALDDCHVLAAHTLNCLPLNGVRRHHPITHRSGCTRRSTAESPSYSSPRRHASARSTFPVSRPRMTEGVPVSTTSLGDLSLEDERLNIVKRFDGSQGPRIIRPTDGKSIDLGACGVRFMVWGEEAGGGFSLVEHPIPPRHLAAPMHRHTREDEYSYVLEGRLGASLGDQIVYAEPGDLVFKPRDQWHTFWNAGDTLCRILEIISPAGFEHLFEQLVEEQGPDVDLSERFGTQTDMSGTHRICEEFGLVFPPPSSKNG